MSGRGGSSCSLNSGCGYSDGLGSQLGSFDSQAAGSFASRVESFARKIFGSHSSSVSGGEGSGRVPLMDGRSDHQGSVGTEWKGVRREARNAALLADFMGLYGEDSGRSCYQLDIGGKLVNAVAINNRFGAGHTITFRFENTIRSEESFEFTILANEVIPGFEGEGGLSLHQKASNTKTLDRYKSYCVEMEKQSNRGLLNGFMGKYQDCSFPLRINCQKGTGYSPRENEGRHTITFSNVLIEGSSINGGELTIAANKVIPGYCGVPKLSRKERKVNVETLTKLGVRAKSIEGNAEECSCCYNKKVAHLFIAFSWTALLALYVAMIYSLAKL